ncbi:NAD-dependent epimerase/dehydratase family protein [Pseudorhodoplanes sinuspersici]|uniref:dTDP-glucose 4,6-dehydratase n=1 Tax=Pseudorhodoplanes sinuspersici TaxID=1235591 RepID=A0A1W6ZWX9_9HYPH|nr:NAD(P)-dependent oxidoreductase [Pseudorhodoplanes sinuspersici]ARQ01823.1 dTDP-glucose 4,6-dehydratase [Pseudorhodoplanes sinuspersici]RKE73577.1 nucleoside-diphosphate-sugar epimerase [Pseudorhodoplanes sinuspersici]
MKIFLAGATGVIGRRLVVLLRKTGHEVVGTTRSETKAAALQALGATAAVVDAYDAQKLKLAVYAAQPDVVIHQLTDLPQDPDPVKLEVGRAANARLRIEGTRNLVDAALASGVRRVIAQSIAFAYTPGQGPLTEDQPLDLSQTGVIALEQAVTQTQGIDGIVLRYGRLYGPGTWTDIAKGPGPLHVDAAAQAALLALAQGKPGIFNLAEDDGTVSSEKAKRELGFDAAFRIGTG